MQNSDISMGVGSLLCTHFAVHVEQVGPDQPWFHHSLGLGWLTQLTLDVISLSCFGRELGRLSGQLLVGPSASNSLSVGGTGVGLSIGSTPTTEFSLSICSRLLLMGNR